MVSFAGSKEDLLDMLVCVFVENWRICDVCVCVKDLARYPVHFYDEKKRKSETKMFEMQGRSPFFPVLFNQHVLKALGRIFLPGPNMYNEDLSSTSQRPLPRPFIRLKFRWRYATV